MNLQGYELKKPKKGITKPSQDLAYEIVSYFKSSPKPISFGLVMGAIKRLGEQKLREIFSDIKQSKVENPAAIFMWRLRK